jgi:UDP-glucose 4-epimerase
MSSSPSSPKRLLVTGGRGRLASLVADYFRAPAYEVSLFSRGTGSGFRQLADATKPEILSVTDTLLHLAWSTLPATSEQSPGTEQQFDLPLLEKLLAALTALPGPQRPHFIFFSSGGTVYGNALARPSREDDACLPIGRYGQAKLAAEGIIRAAAIRHGLPCTILRISNPYGYPVPRGRAQGIIPHAIRAAVENQPLTLWGDGHARKDFIYYTDFLSAVAEIVDRRLTGVFNICAGESHTVHEIIRLVEDHTHRRVSTRTTPAPAWDVQDSRLDNTRLVQATGWRPQVTLDEGVRRSTAGFLDQ